MTGISVKKNGLSYWLDSLRQWVWRCCPCATYGVNHNCTNASRKSYLAQVVIYHRKMLNTVQKLALLGQFGSVDVSVEPEFNSTSLAHRPFPCLTGAKYAARFGVVNKNRDGFV